VAGEQGTEPVLIILVAIAVSSALAALEDKKLMRSIIWLAVMFISVGLMYWLVVATYVALFHLLVYAGAVVILLVAAVMFTGGEEA